MSYSRTFRCQDHYDEKISKGKNLEMKFVADSMLGRLAKWLRVLGYDTIYRSCYQPHVIDLLVKDGRILLSRRKDLTGKYSNSVMIYENNVERQIVGLKRSMGLIPDHTKWFCRCLICNTLLQEIHPNDALGNVPDYVFHQNMKGIHYCPSCGRYYWPGSHKTRMLRQLEKWGF